MTYSLKTLFKGFLKKKCPTAQDLIDKLPQALSQGYIGTVEWIYEGVECGTLFTNKEAHKTVELLKSFGYKESDWAQKHNARREKERAEWIIGQALFYLSKGFFKENSYLGLPKRLKPVTKLFLKKVKRKEKNVIR
ncbi:MAG: hypothetical protein EOM53_00085 [Alphaproteobacteria bacterium]|nr:hypothetical protein [Alphaproteobacteria bacterium]